MATVTGTEPRPATTAAGEPTPIVLDLGKQRRKRVKELRRGEGKLMAEIIDALEELKLAGTLAASAQPVVIVVQQKRRKMKSLLPGF
jgi:hypothetical protein